MGWELHAIATFAGHRSTDSTLRYIHLSGRDLAEKLNTSMAQIHAWRMQMLTGARHRPGRRGVNAVPSPAAATGGRGPRLAVAVIDGRAGTAARTARQRALPRCSSSAGACAATGPVGPAADGAGLACVAAGWPRRWMRAGLLCMPGRRQYRRAGAQAAAICVAALRRQRPLVLGLDAEGVGRLCGRSAATASAPGSLPTDAHGPPVPGGPRLPARRVHRLPSAGHVQPPAPGQAGLRRRRRSTIRSARPRGSSTGGVTGSAAHGDRLRGIV